MVSAEYIEDYLESNVYDQIFAEEEEKIKSRTRQFADFKNKREKVWEKLKADISEGRIDQEDAELVKKYVLQRKVAKIYADLMVEAKQNHLDGEFLAAELIKFYDIHDVSDHIGPESLNLKQVHKRFERNYDQAIEKLIEGAEIKKLLDDEKAELVDEGIGAEIVDVSKDLREKAEEDAAAEASTTGQFKNTPTPMDLFEAVYDTYEYLQHLFSDDSRPFRGDILSQVEKLKKEKQKLRQEIAKEDRDRKENLGNL